MDAKELTAPARVQSLIAELDWCIANGHAGPRTAQAVEHARAALVAIISDAAQAPAVPVELQAVEHELKRGDGFWRTCSGCYESEDGYPVGHYPHSAILGCTLGGGCSECGGIGAVWDDTDYGAMADAMHAEMIAQENAAPVAPAAGAPFQGRVQPWLLECFGAEIAADREERNHRFFEEATELVQAFGMTASEAHQLVDYTFGRPIGEPAQEVGGVMVTLAALCLANGLDMHAAGETELARIRVPGTVAKIRAKQAAKPKHSPLPASPAPLAAAGLTGEQIAALRKASAVLSGTGYHDEASTLNALLATPHGDKQS